MATSGVYAGSLDGSETRHGSVRMRMRWLHPSGKLLFVRQGNAVCTVVPDGQRFLMNTVTEEVTSPITVILNWKPKP